MTALAPFVVHTAAPPVGAVQSCAACGWGIVDNTPWFEGQVAVPEGDADRGPGWYPAGARVATDKTAPGAGGMTYLLGPEGRPLDGDERLCAGTN
jgi:hypothetical protein